MTTEDKIDKILELQYEGIELIEIASRVGYTSKGKRKIYTMNKFMKRNGYDIVDDNYISIDDKSNINNDEDNQETRSTKDIKNKSLHKDKSLEKESLSSRGTMTDDRSNQYDIIDIVKSDKEIKEMLKFYKGLKLNDDTHIQNDDNRISIDLDTTEEQRTTVRVNSKVWSDFLKLTEDNRYLLKKDLLSMALKEYVAKYKK